MKKIVSILLIACMIFAFAGCSSEENTLTVALSPDFAPMEFVDITKSGQDQYAIYARSYKCKYDRKTGELISRELEAKSTYNI